MAAPAGSPRPDFVLFMAGELRAESIGCYESAGRERPLHGASPRKRSRCGNQVCLFPYPAEWRGFLRTLDNLI